MLDAAAGGAHGGLQIAENTLSFGIADKLRLTDTSRYNGKAFSGSAAAATVSREAILTAATLGTAQIARGGIAGTSFFANLINAGASNAKVYNSARVIANALTAHDAASGAAHFVNGARRVYQGDDRGYLEAGTGGIQIYGASRSLQELTALKQGGAHAALSTGGGINRHHLPAKRISPIPEKLGPSVRMSVVDHKQTLSSGSSNRADLYKVEVFRMPLNSMLKTLGGLLAKNITKGYKRHRTTSEEMVTRESSIRKNDSNGDQI